MAEADIEGLNKLLNRLDELALDTKRVRRPLRTVGVYMLGSIEKNFLQQGRPEKWMPLSPRTLATRRSARSKRKEAKAAGQNVIVGRGSRILIDTARLKNSISVRLEDRSVEVGTNVIYARRQHFGYPGGKKGRGQVQTPARPFLMFQNEDFDKIGDIFRNHIARR